MDPLPIRFACDRCHSRKLRCLRRDSDADCARCIKNGATCIYSRSQRGRKSIVTGNNSQKRSRSTAIGSEASDVVNKTPIDARKSKFRIIEFSGGPTDATSCTSVDENSLSYGRYEYD